MLAPFEYTNLDEGNYTYAVTDDNGCSIAKNITLTKPEELKINFGDFKIPSCHENDMGEVAKREDGQIQLSVNGGAMLGYKTNIYQLDGIQPQISKGELRGILLYLTL